MKKLFVFCVVMAGVLLCSQVFLIDAKAQYKIALVPTTTTTNTLNPTSTGACCLFSKPGACEVTTKASCNGAYKGNGVQCQPINPCTTPTPTPTPQPKKGACCLLGPKCVITTERVCTSERGSYKGDDTTCESNPCVQATPTPEPQGACCLGFRCEVTTESNCTDLNGRYKGNGTSCEPNTCEYGQGACCQNGDCTRKTALECGQVAGTYKGDGTTCDPNPCTFDLCTWCQSHDCRNNLECVNCSCAQGASGQSAPAADGGLQVAPADSVTAE